MDKDSATTSPQQCALTVLYDGACPLCSREIALYRRLESRDPIAFRDVSEVGCELPDGLDRPQVLARFHVVAGDGTVESGARAFVALWERLPGWRWLARSARIPGVTPLLELGYRLFLPLRPWLQRLAGAGR